MVISKPSHPTQPLNQSSKSNIIYEHVRIDYDNQTVIHDFSASIDTGQKTVFSGPSGSGKSTLMNALMGFVTLTQGRILLGDLEVNAQNIGKIRQQIAWLPQNLDLDVSSCRDVFNLPFQYLANKTHQPTESQSQEMLKRLLLPDNILDKTVDEISGGQKQRLMLASILLLPKPVLLLDEPTSALDTESANQLLQIITEQGKTVISSSHDPFWVKNMDQVIEVNHA